jgi:hypothetical protein
MFSSHSTSTGFLCVKHNPKKAYKGHYSRAPDWTLYLWRNSVQCPLNSSISVGICMSSITWLCVVTWVVPSVSKNHSAFIFMDQAVQEERPLLLGLLDHWTWRHYDPLRSWEPLIEWQSVTSHNKPSATPLWGPQTSQPLSSCTPSPVTFCHCPHFPFNRTNSSCHCVMYFLHSILKTFTSYISLA